MSGVQKLNRLLDIGVESIMIAELDLLPTKIDSGNHGEFRYMAGTLRFNLYPTDGQGDMVTN